MPRCEDAPCCGCCSREAMRAEADFQDRLADGYYDDFDDPYWD